MPMLSVLAEALNTTIEPSTAAMSEPASAPGAVASYAHLASALPGVSSMFPAVSLEML